MGAFDPVIIVTNAGGGTLARRLAPPLHALACSCVGISSRPSRLLPRRADTKNEIPVAECTHLSTRPD
jgi:hypothetical protein